MPGSAASSKDGDAAAEGVRRITIACESPAASALLVFQAVFPFLLFRGGAAANGEGGAGKEPVDPASGSGPGSKAPVIELTIRGGTCVSWSPTFDYVDGVLLPTLQERFACVDDKGAERPLAVERKCIRRGWSSGPVAKGPDEQGEIWFSFRPLGPGEALVPRTEAVPIQSAAEPVVDASSRWDEGKVKKQRKAKGNAHKETTWDAQTAAALPVVSKITATILAPPQLHEPLRLALDSDLGRLFEVDNAAGVSAVVAPELVDFAVVEDSGHESRIYVLLVAERAARPGPGPLHSGAGKSPAGQQPQAPLRCWFGRDILYSGKRKGKNPAALAEEVARRVARSLHREIVASSGLSAPAQGLPTPVGVDEYLHDQLVVFQALAKGRTSFAAGEDGGRQHEEKGGRGASSGAIGRGTRGQDGKGARPKKGRDRKEKRQTANWEYEEEEEESVAPQRGVERLMEDLGLDEPESDEERSAEPKDLGLDMSASDPLERDRTEAPFGDGSTHAQTARWVASQLLSGVFWYNKGTVCDGVGISSADI